MKFVATLIALLIAAGVILGAGPAAAASRSCGYVDPYEYDVKVELGQVTCKEARMAIKTVINGGGKRHGNPDKGALESLYWTIPGGWKCATGAGGAWTCVRGGTFSDPKDRVSAEQRVEEEAAHGNY